MGEVTTAAAMDGERLISICRFFFCGLVTARFVAVDFGNPWQANAVGVPVTIAAMVFSVWMVATMRRHRARPWMIAAAVVLDAATCFLSLLQSVLWPGRDGYTALLERPDVNGMLVVAVAAGFRLSPRLALLGGGANAAGFALLMAIERGMYGGGAGLAAAGEDVFLFSVYLAGAICLSVAGAARARRLVQSGSLASFKIEHVRRELGLILHQQHDARSLLSAAALNADLIRRALNDRGASAREEALRLADHLEEDLAEANLHIVSAGEQAFGHASLMRSPEPVDVAAVLPAVLSALRRRFPGVALDGEIEEPPPRVELVGGRASFERILYNLVRNAAEGDGRRGARRIRITARRGGRGLALVVRDDGPGFAPAAVESRVSGKQNGNGLGLHCAALLLEMSGGTITIGDAAGGGAIVALELRAI
jgi:signal transduction histidine kinase